MRAAKARGLCGKHVQRLYKHGDASVSLVNREHDNVCSIEGCNRPYYGNGLCRLHDDRQRAHGDPTLADDLIEWQNGLCGICHKPADGRGHESRLHLDHNHRTDEIRGMLCGRCNKALGLFNDDAILLKLAITYLGRPPAVKRAEFHEDLETAARGEVPDKSIPRLVDEYVRLTDESVGGIRAVAPQGASSEEGSDPSPRVDFGSATDSPGSALPPVVHAKHYALTMSESGKDLWRVECYCGWVSDWVTRRPDLMKVFTQHVTEVDS